MFSPLLVIIEIVHLVGVAFPERKDNPPEEVKKKLGFTS